MFLATVTFLDSLIEKGHDDGGSIRPRKVRAARDARPTNRACGKRGGAGLVSDHARACAIYRVRRGRGGLPIAAPDGASARAPQELYPGLAAMPRLDALNTAEIQVQQYATHVREFMCNSAFFPKRKKVKPDLYRYQDVHLTETAVQFTQSADLMLVKGVHAPAELFNEQPRKRIKRSRQLSGDMAEVLIGGLDDDDEGEEGGGGGEDGEGGGGKAGANANGPNKKPTHAGDDDEEEEPEEDEDEGDYGENYFDNGDDYEEKESGDDEPFY